MFIDLEHRLECSDGPELWRCQRGEHSPWHRPTRQSAAPTGRVLRQYRTFSPQVNIDLPFFRVLATKGFDPFQPSRDITRQRVTETSRIGTSSGRCCAESSTSRLCNIACCR